MAYDGEERFPIRGGEYFEQLRQGTTKFNITDHLLLETPFANDIEVPFVLRDNWYTNTNLWRKGHDLCFILTREDFVTEWHEDGEGIQIWAYTA